MDYGGSTALGFFVRLSLAVRDRGGRMAFCNVSEHEREILETTNLDWLCPLCVSRQDALRAVRGEAFGRSGSRFPLWKEILS
jgi:anti-anti-sigma regulatory factor